MYRELMTFKSMDLPQNQTLVWEFIKTYIKTWNEPCPRKVLNEAFDQMDSDTLQGAITSLKLKKYIRSFREKQQTYYVQLRTN